VCCICLQLAEGGSLYSRLYSRSSASKAQQQQLRQQQAAAAAAAAASQGAGSSSSSSAAAAPPPRPRRAGAPGCSSSKGVPPPPLSVAEVLRIAVDVSRAMVYLHTLQPQVVHRDLKPQNVLLDLQGRAKVRRAECVASHCCVLCCQEPQTASCLQCCWRGRATERAVGDVHKSLLLLLLLLLSLLGV
jgi:serine/threonine protein kinase